MRNLRTIISVLVMMAALFAASTAFASSLEGEVLYHVNVERAAAGLAPLTYNVSLANAASVRASEASVHFGHVRPDGRDVKTVLGDASYAWFGENLAVSTTEDAKRIVRAWMASPTHRANLLNRHFTQMGVAVTRGVDGHLYWAELLASN